MSTRRNPIYVFKDRNSMGIYDVPVESMVQIIDSDWGGTPIFTQLVSKKYLTIGSDIGHYLDSGDYEELDKDTTYDPATTTMFGLMSPAHVIKLNTIEDGATKDQTKGEIEAMRINATTIDGLKVETAVPVNAVFVDTVYDDTVLANNVQINANKINQNTVDITTARTGVADNTIQIGVNTTAIATNTFDIVTNSDDIVTNTAAIATNQNNILTNTTNVALNNTAIQGKLTASQGAAVPDSGGTTAQNMDAINALLASLKTAGIIS